MCGIHGVFDTQLSPAEVRQLLQSMTASQRHRGPDDCREILFDEDIGRGGFGFVRLAILDLDTGMQPICSPLTGSTVVCNGQVYNYRELRQDLSDLPFETRGDIEPILHLYDRLGEAFLPQLNGMYAGALYSPLQRHVLLFNDRFGIKPLYYAHQNGRFCFASEIKALRHALPEPPAIDTEALSLYLTYGYVPGKKTLFKNIYQLPPGSCLTYDLETRELTLASYWRYRPAPPQAMTLDAAADRFIELFEDSVRLRCHADVPVGSLLSSGIDSCAVASIAKRFDPEMQLFTVAFAESEFDESSRVADFADSWLDKANACRYIRTASPDLEDFSEIIHSLDEPLMITSLLPTWALFKVVSGSHKVVLTGEGADELFAGYGWFWLDQQARRQSSGSPLQSYQRCRMFFDPSEASALIGHAAPYVNLPGASCDIDVNSSPLETLLQMESRCRLPASNLARLDRMAMAHSVEARTPFLDYRIAEFAATLPSDLKLGQNRSEQKHVCREAFLKHSVLPESIARLPKQPFCAPVDEWFRASLKGNESFQAIAHFAHPLFEDLVDPAAARQMTTGFLADKTSPFSTVSSFERFWNLCTLAVWYERVFLGGDRAATIQ